MNKPYALLRSGFPFHATLGMRRVTTNPMDMTIGKDDKPLQVRQEVYRTKGASKSILAHLGKDIQSCLQKQSGAK